MEITTAAVTMEGQKWSWKSRGCDMGTQGIFVSHAEVAREGLTVHHGEA
jgi:hypothetical protein